ncbi:MAG TPA: hypothetical protein VH643_34450 [Gemmataceae bacterium]
MDQLIPSLDSLLAPLAAAFRTEVFALFRCMVAAWIVCLGRRHHQPRLGDYRTGPTTPPCRRRPPVLPGGQELR